VNENSSDPLCLKAQRRDVPAGVPCDASLPSLAWHALAQSADRVAEMARTADNNQEEADTAWVALADACFRLERLMPDPASGDAQEAPVSDHSLSASVSILRQSMEANGVEIMSYTGATYAAELGDYVHVAGLAACQGISDHTVGEMVEPVVRRRGRVIRPGKAIIQIPSQDGGPEAAGHPVV